MRAIVIESHGASRTLALRDVAEPQVGPTELKVAVRAAGVNRADLRRANTHFAASEATQAAAVAGLEFAGEVVAVGKDVSGIAPGDRVMAMGGGAFADYVCVDARLAIKIPGNLEWAAAAAIPVSYIAAYNALITAAECRRGESVFINGASSGAGIAAIQIALAMGAAPVIGTAGVADKLRRLHDLGCQVPIDYRAENVAALVRQHTRGHGANVVIDIVGGTAAQKNIDAAAISARIVCLGRVAGSNATIDMDEIARKRLHLIGVTFRTRSFEERIAAVATFRANLLPLIASGAIKPVVDRVLPLAKADDAQEYMRSNQHFGKIVLVP